MSKLTRIQEAEQRYLMAMYYAYGRADAGAKIDPMKFAEHYVRMFEDMQRGLVGFCPSVQDAFGYFLSIHTDVVHNDDEPVA